MLVIIGFHKMGKIEDAENRVNKYIIGPKSGDLGYDDEIFEPGKATIIGSDTNQFMRVLVLEDGVSIRKQRSKGVGRIEMGKIMDIPVHAYFDLGIGESALVLNRGDAPFVKRRVTIGSQTQNS